MRLQAITLLLMLPAAVGAQAGRAAFDAGVVHMRANEAAKAESQFEKAIKAEPAVGEYHLWLGRAIGQQTLTASKIKQPFMAKRSKSAFERAVALDPALIDGRDALIQFYLMAPGFMGGSATKAREQQREIAKLDPVRGHYAASEIAWHAKDTLATEAALRAAMEAAPDSARGAIVLAQRQALWGRNTAAFATLDAFLARQPQDIAVRFQLGRLAAVTGLEASRGERALRDLLGGPEWEAGGLRPSKAVVHFRLGGVLERLDRKPEARAAYEEALRLDPKLTLARTALKAMK